MAPNITFGSQLGQHRQCGMAVCTFHLGFSLGAGTLLGCGAEPTPKPVPSERWGLANTPQTIASLDTNSIPKDPFILRGCHLDIPIWGGAVPSNRRVFVDNLEADEKTFVLVGGRWGENLWDGVCYDIAVKFVASDNFCLEENSTDKAPRTCYGLAAKETPIFNMVSDDSYGVYRKP